MGVRTGEHAGAMETTTTPEPRTLSRSPDDRKLLGVCGGVGEYLGIDPVIVRVVTVVLAFVGGIGIVAYLLGAALLPERGQQLDLGSGNRPALLILAILAALLFLPGSFWFGWQDASTVLVLLGVGLLAYYLVRSRASRPTYPPPTGEPVATGLNTTPVPEATMTDTHDTAPFADVDSYATTPYGDDAQQPPPYPPYGYQAVPPAPPRQRSYLGGITLGLSLIWFGLAWALNAAGLTSMSAVTIFGVSLGIIGAGLLLGAWFGRARWLIVLALPLSLIVWGLASVPDSIRLADSPQWISGGIGEATFAPESAADDTFELGVGSAELRVADWEPYGSSEVTAEVGLGELVIYVPDDWNVTISADLGAGELRVDDRVRFEGPGIEETLTFPAAEPESPTMTIDASVDLGAVRIITD